MWMMLHAHPRPCFNPELLNDIAQLTRAAKKSGFPIDFWVTGSTVPGIYNVGVTCPILPSTSGRVTGRRCSPTHAPVSTRSTRR